MMIEWLILAEPFLLLTCERGHRGKKTSALISLLAPESSRAICGSTALALPFPVRFRSSWTTPSVYWDLHQEYADKPSRKQLGSPVSLASWSRPQSAHHERFLRHRLETPYGVSSTGWLLALVWLAGCRILLLHEQRSSL